ncbi:hypothetical protein AXF42_Ash013447 [Apostasia shenzhenica]|uniref:Uncharacterized protein n=1 Tax=Apostasia shenzhenica TaxID=1088818 RepID=A0A2I0A489_9ASPA|nr:hypothetical protein AXF42_Ash013447 [Apostasia shenzhenica]
MARKLGPRRGCQPKEEERPTKGRATRQNSWSRRKRDIRGAPGGIHADPTVSCRPRGKSAWESTLHKCLSATENSGNSIRFFDAFSTRLGRVCDSAPTRVRRV